MTTAGAALGSAVGAPLSDVAAITGDRPVLVLAPHPDDESLGCGGLIATCAAAGIAVTVARLTDGAGSHPGSLSHPPELLARVRGNEMRQALRSLGLDTPLHELGWPDRHAPTGGPAFDRAVAQVAALARDVGAGCIVTAWGSDPHCDHEACSAIALAAAQACAIGCIAYPVWGWLLPPDTVVVAGAPLRLDIRAQLPAKRRAIACHRSQYGGLIDDADDGFVLPEALIAACTRPDEVFFRLHPGVA